MNGNEKNGTPLYPCVADYDGGKHPGKKQASAKVCNIGYDGKRLKFLIILHLNQK
jgi:hypothetical protein